MRSSAKPVKAKVEAKLPVAGKSRKNENSRASDPDKLLAEALRREAEAQKRLAEALEQQTATAEILRLISSSPSDLQPVLDAMAERAARLCAAYNAIILRLDGNVLSRVAHHGPLAAPPALVFPATRDTVGGRTVLDRHPIHVADLQAQTEEFPVGSTVARQLGSRTVLGVPLLREGAAIGVIYIRRTEVQPFTEAQIALLQTFADQAVIAIENTRLFKELEARNCDLTLALERETASGDILRVISISPTDVQPVMQTIVDSAVRLADADDAMIGRAEGDQIRWLAAAGTQPGPLQPITRSLPSGRAILDRRTTQVDDISVYGDEFPAVAAAYRKGVRTILATPLLREGNSIGVVLVRRTAVRPFTDQQIALLQTFADQAAIAIESVRLFTELQQKNEALTQADAQVTEALERQTATSEILRTIAHAQTDTQPVFDTIVQNDARLCHASNAAVFQTDGTTLYEPASFGSAPEALAAARSRFPRSLAMDSTADVAILTRSLFHVPDTEGPSVIEHLRQSGRLVGFRSVVTVPMLREGEAIGAILVARREPGRFSDAEVELLRTFADQAVIAVENVRLFKELEARTAALARSVDQLTALGEVGRAVSSTLDLETVLTTIVSRAVQLSRLDGGVVFEYDDGIEEFVQRVATETGGALAEARRTTRIRKGEGVLGRTAVTLEPVQVPDITAPDAYEGRLRETLIGSGIRAILAVPMLREGQLIGCLGVTPAARE